MANYDFTAVEEKWQKHWKNSDLYQAKDQSDKPKFYSLDMFPYPSGAGLHVGHPLGYIASDIISRHKRMKGFNVLHPIGFDSFGLPAEQHAIATGQHPAVTTDINIKNYKSQLEKIAFSFDWNREFRTSDPSYYKWTQWIFLKLFNAFFDEKEQKAKPIDQLEIPSKLNKIEKEAYINDHRLAYQDNILVNWCPALGTVLANEEVIGGLSERGGHPVVRKPMKQWMMRITKYSQRLLDDLDQLDWPDSIKLSQKNWIGRSEGAHIHFDVQDTSEKITVFTTRPDTIYGVTYLVLAPEHQLVDQIATDDQKEAIAAYREAAAKKSDLERTELEKDKTGVFTGSYATNPINGEQVPIWISDYVLISYGTGSVMAVPFGDQRDFEFAKKYDLPIVQVISPDGKDMGELSEAFSGHGILLNSGEYDGQESKKFFRTIIDRLEKEGSGKAMINYKIRDWVFTRQRYWGEPIPVYHDVNGKVLPALEDELPIELPETDSYKPSDSGESPLHNIRSWVEVDHPKYGKVQRETNTMPQWAGSCWYYLRFMDPTNEQAFASEEALKNWESVDLYIGGAEHAVLHLLYARFWHKVLFDLNLVPTNEPFKKLINQGMIQGRSSLVYREKGTNNFVSAGLKKDYEVDTLHVDVNIVNEHDELDLEKFKAWREDLASATFVLEDGKYKCGSLVEKMSKSLYNVVNPNQIIEKYGSDTFRMYEMFLGPIEQFKPWNTNGIDGVFKFVRKFWSLFHNEEEQFIVSEEKASADALKVVHQTIKKVNADIDRFSLNTCVSHFMICVNELTKLKANQKEALEPLVKLIAPFAPHIAEELWSKLGNQDTVTLSDYPLHQEELIKENDHEYPVSVNGKMRVKLKISLSLSKEEIEKVVFENEIVQKWTEGKTPKKVIIVPGRIVNIVV